MSTNGAVVYTQCGLRMRSEIEVHLPRSPEERWDVNVTWGDDIPDSKELPPGEIIAAYGSEEDRWYSAAAVDDGYLLRFHDCGEFVISSDLRTVRVRRDPAGQSELLPILVAGTLSAFLLTLRGETVLHASAVAIDGVALAFVGQSGRGKTTVAALLCVNGAELVTDDLLTVRVAGGRATCVGGASELRLRAGAAALAEEHPEAVTRTTSDDRLALAPAMAPPGPLPLAAIVIPGPTREATEMQVRLVPPAPALFGLLTFPRIHGWSRPDVLSRDFATLGELVNVVPVYEVEIPWGPPFQPSIAPALAALVEG